MRLRKYRKQITVLAAKNKSAGSNPALYMLELERLLFHEWL
jgi:hypothetical protein